jgi:energy-coupling factor transport system ATP-binding protein
MIRLENVSWTYPHSVVPSLRGVDLRVDAGQFVVLCGPSGCGKSTVLRVINGLIPHFHDDGTLTGEVRVGGIVPAESELDRIGQIVGTVLQHPRRQFFAGTPNEELAFAMENFGFPPERIRQRVAMLAEQFVPPVPADTALRNLSGGLQQQIAIAAAMAHRPQLLLLDEPSSNLSAAAVQQLADVLRVLKAQGVTLVVAEHRLRYLRELADRVVVLRDGAIDIQWSAQEFCLLPDSVLAAEGLRGDLSPISLPVLAAEGASVASPSTAPTVASKAVPTVVPGKGLELEGVRCRLGGRMVVDLQRAAFPVAAVTAIRGGNGVGKSTLARIVAGLQRASGQLRLDGKPLRAHARQRVSAIVMQDVQRQLFTDTVAAEVELAVAARKGQDNVSTVLAALDLEHLAERHPLSLSGGQQQRLVVATARMAGRRIVIFDEPSSGVDRRHLASISAQIRQLADDGAVVLLISHDQDLIALAADWQLTLTSPS